MFLHIGLSVILPTARDFAYRVQEVYDPSEHFFFKEIVPHFTIFWLGNTLIFGNFFKLLNRNLFLHVRSFLENVVVPLYEVIIDKDKV